MIMGKLYLSQKTERCAAVWCGIWVKMLSRHNGYKEGETAVVTWCVGHLVTMSYPDVYDEKYKKWRLRHFRFYRKSSNV